MGWEENPAAIPKFPWIIRILHIDYTAPENQPACPCICGNARQHMCHGVDASKRCPDLSGEGNQGGQKPRGLAGNAAGSR